MPRPDRRTAGDRKRGFDDEQPPEIDWDRLVRPETSRSGQFGESAKAAIVKWFNAEKGFGFVQMADGTGDVFLHANTLRRLGVDSVGEGAALQVRVGPGQKGLQVVEVVSVAEGAAPAGQDRPRASRPRPSLYPGESQLPTGAEVTGQVKWFNATKGFGFITPEGGGKDVFVHISALERSGLTTLAEGQAVRFTVRQGTKGVEASGLSLI